MSHMTAAVLSPDRRRVWMRRIGAMSFCFFLIKGLAWLVVPLVLWFGAME